MRTRLRPGLPNRAETRQVPFPDTFACAPGVFHLPAWSTSSQHVPAGCLLEVTRDETASRRCRDVCGIVEWMLVATFAAGDPVVGSGTGVAGVSTGDVGPLAVNVVVEGPVNVAFGVIP